MVLILPGDGNGYQIHPMIFVSSTVAFVENCVHTETRQLYLPRRGHRG